MNPRREIPRCDVCKRPLAAAGPVVLLLWAGLVASGHPRCIWGHFELSDGA